LDPTGLKNGALEEILGVGGERACLANTTHWSSILRLLVRVFNMRGKDDKLYIIYSNGEKSKW